MRRIYVAMMVLGTLVCSVAQAEVAYSFPIGKDGIYTEPSFDAVEGNLFQIGSTNLVVTRLGYEYQREGQSAATTAIFDAETGDLLASADISSSDSLENGYYWQGIDALTLFAGKQYYIGSLHGTGPGQEYWWNTREATVPSYMFDLGTYFKVSSTIEGGTWQYGGGISQYGSGGIRHYVGNFDASAVPEPASLMALGIGALALLRRRRSSR